MVIEVVAGAAFNGSRKLTDKFVEDIAKHGAHKEKEIMEV